MGFLRLGSGNLISVVLVEVGGIPGCLATDTSLTSPLTEAPPTPY